MNPNTRKQFNNNSKHKKPRGFSKKNYSSHGNKKNNAPAQFFSDAKRSIIMRYSNIAFEGNIVEKLGDEQIRSDLLRKFKEAPLFSQKEKEALQHLVHFLWAFKLPDVSPQNNEEMNMLALLYLEKLEAFRNFFSHSGKDEKEINEALDFGGKDDKFYRLYTFIGGELFLQARREFYNSSGEYLNPKLFSKDKETEHVILKKEGLLFFLSLALFKDEAEALMAKFPEKSFSPKYKKAPSEADKQKKRLDAAARRKFFSYYSLPRSFRDLARSDATNDDTLDFVEIINYLNKAPAICDENLTLRNERSRLAELKQEALANNAQDAETRYELKIRAKEKFISYALRGLVRFNLLPEIRFKRYDRSEEKQGEFAFGARPGESVRDIAFAVNPEKIDFEYLPTAHCGNADSIKIKSLRCSFPPKELERMLWFLLSRQGKSAVLRKELSDYLAAYHRLLERLLSLSDEELAAGLNPHDYRDELEKICGEPLEAIVENFRKKTHSVFSTTIINLFAEAIPQPSLQSLLRKKLESEIRRSKETQESIHEKSVNDGEKIRAVFQLLNFYLEDHEKFRQLPHNERHKGQADFEYQVVHQKLGQYNTKKRNGGFWEYLEKNDNPARQKLYKKIRGLSGAKALHSLAYSALDQYIRECSNILKNSAVCNQAQLAKYCRKFKVRLSPNPCTREILQNSVLGIRVGRNLWPGYQLRKSGISEETFTGFIASQIPVSNGIAERAFGKAFPNLNLQEQMRKDLKSAESALRDFYDISVLQSWLREKASAKKSEKIKLKEKPITYAEADNLSRKIKAVYAQDALLYRLSLRYREESPRFAEILPQGKDGNVNVFGLFDQYVQLPYKGFPENSRVEVALKTIARADFSLVVSKMANCLNLVTPRLEGNKKIYDFALLYERFKEIGVRDDEICEAAYPTLMRLDEKYPGKERPKDCKFTDKEFEQIILFRNAVCHNHLGVEPLLEKLPPSIKNEIKQAAFKISEKKNRKKQKNL